MDAPAAVQHSPDAAVTVDDRGTIRCANERALALFGHPSLTGEPLRRLLPEAPFPLPDRLQTPAYRADDSAFVADVATAPLTGEHPPGWIVAVREDAGLELQRTLAQASRMESIGRLAGGVAHDFNNLLSVIIGNADILAVQLQRGAPGASEVQEIRRAAARAASLTRQLLSFSRADAAEPEPVNLNAVIDDVDRMLRRTLGETIELRTRLAPRLPPILADAGSLEQVLVNLAVNARDAMPGGGTLTTETSVVYLDEEAVRKFPGLRPGEHVRLSVSDTGVGMPPDVLRRVTDPFFTTKPKGAGTGIGLSTVHGIVQRAGGVMTFRSQPGAGTTVTVKFPVAAAGAPAARRPAHRSPSGRGQRVLLVEDEDAVRRIAERILHRNGFEVAGFRDAGGALAALEDPGAGFDLLLTDVVMPEMTGPDLAERVRRSAPALPVVFMSGYVDPVIDLDRVPDAGLVEKPFTEATLTAALAAALTQPD